MMVWMTVDRVQTEIQLRWTLSFHLEKMTSLAAVEISIGHPEEIVNHLCKRCHSRRAEDQIQSRLTLTFSFVQCEIIVSTDGNYDRNCSRLRVISCLDIT